MEALRIPKHATEESEATPRSVLCFEKRSQKLLPDPLTDN